MNPSTDSMKKIEGYKELFSDDPLYLHLQQMNLLDKLFEPCIFYERVVFDATTYSTKQAAELLGIQNNQQTLINFLNREDFNNYIVIYKSGNRYRYDYKTLFQFKMILLLTEMKLTPSDIATLTGARAEYLANDRVSKRSNSGSHNSLPSEQIEQTINTKVAELLGTFIKHYQENEQRVQKTKELESKKHSLSQELHVWESEMRALIGRIEDLETYTDLHRQLLNMYTSSPKEEAGFWKKLFKKEVTQIDGTPLVEEKLTVLQNRLKKLIEEKTQLEAKKSAIYEKLNEVDQQIKLDQLNKTNGQLESSTTDSADE
ncbi:hypothetical protein [Bacillus sp. JJ722]|uniref:hypothetical protein n=1 Tax=Bacillus sp. JJ722 TaxID=3122973 RepID=UPI002FFD6773